MYFWPWKWILHPSNTQSFPSGLIYLFPSFPSTIFNSMAIFWPFSSQTLSVNVFSRCWAWAMMLTTLGKLRAAWRIFFLCPGSVIPTSRRSWSSITLLPCMWTNVRGTSKKTHSRTRGRKHTLRRPHVVHLCAHANKYSETSEPMHRDQTRCRRNTVHLTCILMPTAARREKLWATIHT